jgi:hypothetical protein
MKIHLTKKSANKKTGRIPVSITEEKSCPEICPWKSKGCYAKYGPLGIHWNRVNKNTSKNLLNWKSFCKEIDQLKAGQVWRHNQAGDLPGIDYKIDAKAMKELVKANKNKRGFTYTHKPVLKSKHALNNRKIIKSANNKGFTINLSANNIKEADTLCDLNIAPVTTILPSDSKLKLKTPNGRNIIVCPAEYIDKINCENCQLCAIPTRKSIIGFRAHGSAKKTIDKKLGKIC